MSRFQTMCKHFWQSLSVLCAVVLAMFLPHPAQAQFNTDRLMTSGRIALQYEDYFLSIQYFNRVISARPYLYEPWQLRAIAKYYLDDYTGAENDATKAIALNPYITQLFALRGIARTRQENYMGAIEDYTRAIALNPDDINNWYNRALCYFQAKEPEQALLQTDSVLLRAPKMASAYSLKAQIYLERKDTLEAASWLDKSLALDPHNIPALTARAYIAMAKTQWAAADSLLSEIIRLKPEDISALTNRAICRLNTNNLRGVMQDYDKVIQLDPENFLAHYNRGLLRVELGDDNRAVEDFNFVIRKEPGNFMAIYNRATLLHRIGDLRNAIRDYTTVINQFPNFWTGLIQRAACYRKLGMNAKAELDEFKVFKAQMEKRVGIQQRWSSAKLKNVRKRSEIDIDKYNNFVVADEQTPQNEYQSIFRGKIQNRRVEADIMPMFHPSLKAYNNGVQQYQAYDKDIEQYNLNNKKGLTLYINGIGAGTDTLSVQQTFATIDSLSLLIDSEQQTTQIGKLADAKRLLERSVAYATIQNYEEALADVETYLLQDTTSVIAYWQQSVCMAHMLIYQTAQGNTATNETTHLRMLLEQLISMRPKNPYFQYNMGNFYAMQKNYATAIDYYTCAIQLDDKMAEAYYNRGVMKIKAYGKKSAVEDLSKAGELGLHSAYSLIKK